MEKKLQTELSVIIPVYNEELNISEMYERLTAVCSNLKLSYELIFVNDGSKDGSMQKIETLCERDPNVKYINFSRNFGHQVAVTAGLDYCRGNAAVIIDSDLQDPPELILDLYSKYCEGYQVVYAKRIDRRGENIFKTFTAKLFYRILKAITSIDIPLDTGDFRLIDRKIIEGLKQMPESNKFLRGQIAWLGFKQTKVEFVREKRKHGVTGYPLKKMIKFAMDGVTAFSDMPLTAVTRIGFFVSFVAFLIILYAFYSYFFLHRVITGWTSLIISTMFIGGIQLISTGVLGEYISRINNDIRKRPLYIIEDSNLEQING
ncbi:MAG: glycosyltransferase family 2 protein [Saprospiraceae bacterium]|jgi:glycosyltransferase involved in cell wall biosynthesis|nr:glycosyltransferase family 2 protein [Saprospiraceae bacterium]